MLGGISGYEVTQTTDEDPQRVRLVQGVTLAYLQSELLGLYGNWNKLSQLLSKETDSPGHIFGKIG